MILAKTRYKTHNSELLAIIEAFKIWRHYPESCKYEILVLTDHNKLWQFIVTKNLSSCQVRWAQELSCYHFQIEYCQGKTNGAADALSCFLQQDDKEEANLGAENTQILYRLQCSLTNASISGFNTMFSDLSPQHQVLICGTYALPQLRRFWSTFQTELANKQPYEASIGSMRLRL